MTRPSTEVVPTERICIALFALTLLTAACDGSTEQARDQRPTAAPPSSAAGSACSNEAEVTGTDETREGSPRRADVDGDGTEDEVGLHVDLDAPVGCQAFLVVDTGDATAVQVVWATGAAGGLPQPTLYSFSDVDQDGSYEIVVSEASGASTQFVAVYRMTDGALAPLEVPDTDNGLFAFGGSVGHIETVDCTSDGELVVSRALPAAGRNAADKGLYQVRRIYYTVEGERLKRGEAEVTTVAIEDLEQFPEFRLGPFGTCAAP